MKLLQRVLPLCAAIFAPFLSVSAALTLPHVFGDHMVLQSGLPAPVWGWAIPGEKVSVRFAGQEKNTDAGRCGSILSQCQLSQPS